MLSREEGGPGQSASGLKCLLEILPWGEAVRADGSIPLSSMVGMKQWWVLFVCGLRELVGQLEPAMSQCSRVIETRRRLYLDGKLLHAEWPLALPRSPSCTHQNLTLVIDEARE